MEAHQLAMGPDGSVYFATSSFYQHQVRRIAPDGKVYLVAGAGAGGDAGDGGDAKAAFLYSPVAVAVAPDGTVFIGEANPALRLRKVSPGGIISSVARGTLGGPMGANGPVLHATMSPVGLAVGPDDAVYVADPYNGAVRKIASAMPSVRVTDFVIADQSGAEVYVFDSRGRHLRTVDPVTLVTTWTFAYGSGGLLVHRDRSRWQRHDRGA